VTEPSKGSLQKHAARSCFKHRWFYFSVWFGVVSCLYRAPTAPEPRQMHQCKQVWAGLVQHSSRGISGRRGAGEREGAPPGASPAGGLGAWGFPRYGRSPLCARSVIARQKHGSQLLPALSHPSQHRAGTCVCLHRGSTPVPATGAARPPFWGENCPFWGLWSLSAILGKFFLVKDSPPLPCSGRCLYGAFQVPEELWEDFLFPFCCMAESQMSLGQIQ